MNNFLYIKKTLVNIRSKFSCQGSGIERLQKRRKKSFLNYHIILEFGFSRFDVASILIIFIISIFMISFWKSDVTVTYNFKSNYYHVNFYDSNHILDFINWRYIQFLTMWIWEFRQFYWIIHSIAWYFQLEFNNFYTMTIFQWWSDRRIILTFNSNHSSSSRKNPLTLQKSRLYVEIFHLF